MLNLMILEKQVNVLKNFLNSLVSFKDRDIKDSFFDAILYGLLSFLKKMRFREKRLEMFLEKKFLINLSVKKTLFRRMILLIVFLTHVI